MLICILLLDGFRIAFKNFQSFCNEFLGLNMFDGYKDVYVDMRPQIMDQQWTNCHFDFERRNIHL